MNVLIEINGLDDILKTLDPRLATKAAAPALNRATTQARTAGIKAVTKEYNIKRKTVNEKISLWKASVGRLRAIIRVRSSRMPILSYSVRQLQRGLSVSVKKSTGRKRMGSAFIATIRTRRAVFFREKQSSSKRVGRYPVESVYSPSVTELIKTKAAMSAIRTTASTVFHRRFNHELNRLMRRLR